MRLPFPNKMTQLKELAKGYQKLTPEERFSDFAILLSIMEQAAKSDPELLSRQRAWMDKQKNEVQHCLRRLLKVQHGQHNT